MRAALVFTPDARFFRPALQTAAWALAWEDVEVVFTCEAADIPADYHQLPRELTGRITILTADFGKLTGGLEGHGNFSPAVFRRLLLHKVLPGHFERIVPMDADMFVGGPGLKRLMGLDLKGHVLGAALDMIRLMDMKGGALAEKFRAYRAGLGLAPEDAYFNNGLTVMDRARWEDGEWGERALDFIRRHPEKTPFLDQSALNHLLRGRWAAFSPRANFMGDFHSLDLEAEIRPFIWHFVNSPKPWSPDYRGDARFAALYAGGDLTPRRVRLPPRAPGADDAGFRARLLEFLSRQSFLDL